MQYTATMSGEMHFGIDYIENTNFFVFSVRTFIAV